MYGYKAGQPCLYFKLNKIYGVENEHYNGSIDFPEDMPQDLIDHIKDPKIRNKNQVKFFFENMAIMSSILSKTLLRLYWGKADFFIHKHFWRLIIVFIDYNIDYCFWFGKSDNLLS